MIHGLPLVLLAISLFACGLPSQQHPAPPAPGAVALDRAIDSAVGVHRLDGAVWAIGPRYKANFDQLGVTFTPALGSRAPHNLQLGHTLASILRGENDHFEYTGPGDGPEMQPTALQFRRGDALERYEATPEVLAVS
jgi:hypothetical protein